MSMIDANRTVGELVVAEPGLTRIFERLGIDYCCGGRQSLSTACAEKGLDVNSVVATLNAVAGLEPAGGAETDWSRASLTALCDHIEETHHKYLREELPRIQMLLNKLVSVHGGNHPELTQVREVFMGLADELLGHLPKEERILFPAIRKMEAGNGMPFGAIAAPIQVMEAEHESAGQALEQLRKLTGDYTTPDDGCNTYRATMEALLGLERDTHQHIHKENNILFPRALAFQG